MILMSSKLFLSAVCSQCCIPAIVTMVMKDPDPLTHHWIIEDYRLDLKDSVTLGQPPFSFLLTLSFLYSFFFSFIFTLLQVVKNHYTYELNCPLTLPSFE